MMSEKTTLDNSKGNSCERVSPRYYEGGQQFYSILQLIAEHDLVKYIGEMMDRGELISGEINILIAGSASNSNAVGVAAFIDGLGLDHVDNNAIIADYNRGTLKEQQEAISDDNNFGLQTNFSTINMDLRQSALKSDSMNIIFSSNTLNFCSDVNCYRESLNEMKRVLKPHGKIFVQLIHNSEGKDTKRYKDVYGINPSVEYFNKLVKESGLEMEIIYQKEVNYKGLIVTVSILTK